MGHDTAARNEGLGVPVTGHGDLPRPHVGEHGLEPLPFTKFPQ